MVGIALGAYGLTQALLQIPFGWLSDKWGRKPTIYFGLAIFAVGRSQRLQMSAVEARCSRPP